MAGPGEERRGGAGVPQLDRAPEPRRARATAAAEGGGAGRGRGGGGAGRRAALRARRAFPACAADRSGGGTAGF